MKKAKQSDYYEDTIEEFSCNFIPDKSGTYVIEIDSAITSPKQFSTAIQILGMAKEDDTIEVRITDCPGGSVGATDGLLHAMRKCQAHIHMIAAGAVHSMGSVILLEADSFELAAGFHSLIHCGSWGCYGNANEVIAQSKFDADWRVRKFRETYEGFLTDKELDEQMIGGQLWLEDKTWMDRAQVRSEYFKKKYEKMLKEQNKTVRKTKKPVAETE